MEEYFCNTLKKLEEILRRWGADEKIIQGFVDHEGAHAEKAYELGYGYSFRAKKSLLCGRCPLYECETIIIGDVKPEDDVAIAEAPDELSVEDYLLARSLKNV